MAEDIDQVQQLARAAFIKNAIDSKNNTSSVSANTRSEIGIIQGLSPERLITKIEFRLRGYLFSHMNRQWEVKRGPVMNELGIGNFLAALQVIEDNVAFSFYHEKDIPRLVYHAFAANYPTYIIYANDFNLDAKDFNLIETILFHYILSVYMAARHGGHRNAVRGTLSENVMAKLFEGQHKDNHNSGIKGLWNKFTGKGDNK